RGKMGGEETRSAAAGLWPCVRGIQGGHDDQAYLPGRWRGPDDRAGDATGRCLGTEQTSRDRRCRRRRRSVRPNGADDAGRDSEEQSDEATDGRPAQRRRIGGAAGAEALIYMKSSEGAPNKVLIAYSLIYMLPLSAKIPFNWRDLTPVSVIALDQFVLWVNTQLPYKTVKEFTDAAKTAAP